MAEAPPRHSLVWVDRLRWRDALRCDLDQRVCDEVERWFHRGRPAVARRRTEGEADDGIPLGIPLPPDAGKRRIALSLDRRAVEEVQPPLLLAQAIPSAPAPWQGPLQELDRQIAALGLRLRVYGSLAWQHLTGEAYLTAQSDVDLLLRPAHRAQLDQALRCLQDWERRTGLRADGEVLFPGGSAVAWRELLTARGRVLVKSTAALALADPSEVLRGLERQEAAA